MAFVFRKPKKNIQRRVFGSGEDEENREENGMETEPIYDISSNNKNLNRSESKSVKKDRKEKTEKTKPKQALLSFDDEGMLLSV